MKILLSYPTIVPEKITFESVKNKTFFDLIKLVAMVTKLFQIDIIFFIILKGLTSDLKKKKCILIISKQKQ